MKSNILSVHTIFSLNRDRFRLEVTYKRTKRERENDRDCRTKKYSADSLPELMNAVPKTVKQFISGENRDINTKVGEYAIYTTYFID